MSIATELPAAEAPLTQRVRENLRRPRRIEHYRVLIDGPNLLFDRARKRRLGHAAAHRQNRLVIERVLRVKQIRLRRLRSVKTVLMNIARNSDDGRKRLVIVTAAELNSFTQRILPRKYLSSRHFADDRYVVVAFRIGLRKRAAAQQWNFHGVKIAGTHDIAVYGRNFRIGNAAILNHETGLI